jgi:hypothetical protein
MNQKVGSQVGELGVLPAQMKHCRRKGGASALQEWYRCETW